MYSFLLQQRIFSGGEGNASDPRPLVGGEGSRPVCRKTLRQVLEALRQHHPETFWHSLRVRGYAFRLADVLDLNPEQRRQLGLAALLHDVGKMAVPGDILDKPGALSGPELLRVQEHPVVGERFLMPFVTCPTVLAAVRGHHERYDGAGYPDRLYGPHIPLFARALALVDSFDALTTDRPYHAALSEPQALDYLHQRAGSQFDPHLTGLFGKVLRTTQAHPAAVPVVRPHPSSRWAAFSKEGPGLADVWRPEAL